MGDVVELRKAELGPPSSGDMLLAALLAEHERIIILGVDDGEVASVQTNVQDCAELARHLRKVLDDIVGTASAEAPAPPPIGLA